MHAIFYQVIFLLTARASQPEHASLNSQAPPYPIFQQLEFEAPPAPHQRQLHAERTPIAPRAPAPLLPGYHPLVDKALDGMKDEVQKLKMKQSAVRSAQGKLRGTVSDAAALTNLAQQLKGAIAETRARLHDQKRKEHDIQDDVKKLDRAHVKVVESLRKTLDPKVELLRARAQKKQDGLRNEQDATKYWNEREKNAKIEANAAMRDAEGSHKKFDEMQGQMEWARQQESMADEKFHYAYQMAQEDMQSLRDAESHYESEASKLKAATAAKVKLEGTVHEEEDLPATEQLEDAHEAEQSEQFETNNWKENVKHMKAQVEDMIKQNETARDNLFEMQARAAWTTQEKEVAEKQYKLKKEMVLQKVTNSKYVETKRKAEESKLRAADAALKSADDSLHKMESARAMEEEKVEHSLAAEHNKLDIKMKNSQADRNSTAHELSSLKQKYANWQKDQLHFSEQLAKSAQMSSTAFQAYEEGQREALSKAQAKVYEAELSDDAWGGRWANGD